MTIHYITSHGIGEWTSLGRSDDDFIHVQFTPECNGALTVGTKTFEVKDGRVSIPLSSLKSGEYRPRLEADTGVYVIEGFSKNGYEITMLPTEESVIRRLVSGYHTLEGICDGLEKRVARLEAMCQGHRIFDYNDYERMEK